MKVLALSLWNKDNEKAVNLLTIQDVAQFSYFQRSTVAEFLTFTSQFMADRTAPGERKSVKEKEYMCHSLTKTDKIGGVMICDDEYPQRVAFTFLLKIMEDFLNKYPKGSWSRAPFTDADIRKQFESAQDPTQIDHLMKIQTDLDETKVILYDTIEKVLERGEKLEDIVSKSENLSATSKQFYKTAKSTNSCCVIL